MARRVKHYNIVMQGSFDPQNRTTAYVRDEHGVRALPAEYIDLVPGLAMEFYGSACRDKRFPKAQWKCCRWPVDNNSGKCHSVQLDGRKKFVSFTALDTVSGQNWINRKMISRAQATKVTSIIRTAVMRDKPTYWILRSKNREDFFWQKDVADAVRLSPNTAELSGAIHGRLNDRFQMYDLIQATPQSVFHHRDREYVLRKRSIPGALNHK